MSVFQPSECVPPLMFRVHSSESPGLNRDDSFQSPAFKAGQGLLALHNNERRIMLWQHVSRLKLYTGREETVPDDYISFTPSLTWALQYAHFKRQKNPDDAVHITALKTKDYNTGTFEHTPAVLRRYNLPERGPRNLQKVLTDEYNESEWLATGSMDITGRSCTVTLDALIDQGLHVMYPEYDDPDHRHKLHNRVVQLRRLWQTRMDLPTTKTDIMHAKNLASVFEAAYEPIMRVWFLSLRERKLEVHQVQLDDERDELLREIYCRNPFSQSTFNTQWPDALSDVYQVESLIGQIQNAVMQKRDLGQVIDQSQRDQKTCDSLDQDGDVSHIASKLSRIDLEYVSGL